MPIDVSKAPSSASPLWIIALFIALSEATAGVAAVVTNGSTRIIFACFAVTFPAVVFAVFVWLLIKHAPNLYAPGQYSRDITPEIYRLGISRDDSILIGRAVAESVVPLFGDKFQEAPHSVVVQEVVDRFEAAVEESSVVVSLKLFKPVSDPLQIAVSSSTRIQSLLDRIYFALKPAVRPFTYGKTWLLIDEHGTEYREMGTLWAEMHGLEDDTRFIDAVGIGPGKHLTAVPMKRDRR